MRGLVCEIGVVRATEVLAADWFGRCLAAKVVPPCAAPVGRFIA